MLGANVTIPHKEAVLPWLDEIDPLAARIGAVNTIVRRGHRLVGYNTDAPGVLRALLERGGPGFTLQGEQAVVLGSGGAARGAPMALLGNQGQSLSILGRTETHLAGPVEPLRPPNALYTVPGGMLWN